MVTQRWCSVDGKTWTTTIGNTKAEVFLLSNEETYCAVLRPVSGIDEHVGNFSNIKCAKNACMEAIEDAEDIADVEAIMADLDDTIISEVEL